MKTLIVLICIGFAIAAYCASMAFNFNFNKSRNFLYWLGDTFFKMVGNILTTIVALVIFMGGASSYISHSIQNAFNGLDSIDTSLVNDTIKQVEKADTIDLQQAVKPTKVAEQPKTEKKVLCSVNATLTCYNPDPKQCSGDPFLTASGDRINAQKLKEKKIKWCAVSRDWKKKFPMNSIVEIEGFGQYIVKDLMAAGIYKSFDILQDKSVPQFKYTNRKVTRITYE